MVYLDLVGALIRIKNTQSIEKLTELSFSPLGELLSVKTNNGTYKSGEFEPADTQDKIFWFITDPDTRVCIRRTVVAKMVLYAVEVENSNGFWLNSFETRQEAETYIKANDLKYAEKRFIDDMAASGIDAEEERIPCGYESDVLKAFARRELDR